MLLMIAALIREIWVVRHAV